MSVDVSVDVSVDGEEPLKWLAVDSKLGTHRDALRFRRRSYG